MADVRARVVTRGGEVTVYFFSDEKTAGGGSLRYACLTVDDDGMALLVSTREPHKAGVTEVSPETLGAALWRAFAHVQPRPTTDGGSDG